MREPLAYLLTWTVHGTWLHGDERGSVARDAQGRAKRVTPSAAVEARVRARLVTPEIVLTTEMREVVSRSITDACAFRAWALAATSVRSNHVHVVVEAAEAPEEIMTRLKARATRALREGGLVPRDQAVWTRHGSTRYLWKTADLRAATDYVRRFQDER
jgi:REP element-mobilizing transposase RayT